VSRRSYELVHFTIVDRNDRSQTRLGTAMKLSVLALCLLWTAASINIVILGAANPEDGFTPTPVLAVGWFLTAHLSMSLLLLQKHRQQFSIAAMALMILILAWGIFVVASNLHLFFETVIQDTLG